jgi:hypothetical protein
MQPIDIDKLARVCGGMRLDPTEVDPIDDRRGMSYRESVRRARHAPPPAPLPPLQRHPGDLPHQAGLDDIRSASRRRR